MTEQFPPGYRDPNWKGDTHEDIHDHELEKGGAIIPFFSDKVLELADDILAQMMTIVDESPEVKALSEPERAAFFISLADAFGDSTEN
jgi:hypothetical protein